VNRVRKWAKREPWSWASWALTSWHGAQRRCSGRLGGRRQSGIETCDKSPDQMSDEIQAGRCSRDDAWSRGGCGGSESRVRLGEPLWQAWICPRCGCSGAVRSCEQMTSKSEEAIRWARPMSRWAPSGLPWVPEEEPSCRRGA
jgi:hypothetical protein